MALVGGQALAESGCTSFEVVEIGAVPVSTNRDEVGHRRRGELGVQFGWP